ncbi:transglutaminase domain-containing protein [Actinophytocola sp.]|uniref:transglutaminase domain-containing protein n=1 Tax=Actinophytocola sp. TaxID=1872138 RepID=UPI002ED61C29
MPTTSAPPAADVTSDQLGDLVDLVRRVPDGVRRFALPVEAARSLHRVDEELLNRLVALGLPYVEVGSTRLFDDYDISNIALHLGLMSVRRRAMRAWAGALRRGGDGGLDRRVGYVPTCPAPGHRGPCQYQVLVPGGTRRKCVGCDDPMAPVTSLDVRVRAEWPELPTPVRELLAEVRSVRFFLLPEAIRWDLDFLCHTRLADCGGVTKYLVAAARRRGIPVRFSFGLLVSKPYSTPHCWAEFEVDETWVPVDPLMVAAMSEWAGLPAEQWPESRSPGVLFCRLTDRFTRVAVHNGLWAGLSLPTEVV